MASNLVQKSLSSSNSPGQRVLETAGVLLATQLRGGDGLKKLLMGGGELQEFPISVDTEAQKKSQPTLIPSRPLKSQG